jgi:uncharacterized NAD-dependent epimerase/dehydratase family protein
MPLLVLEGQFSLVRHPPTGGSLGMLLASASRVFDHCTTQHLFMALSTLNPPLPALEDLITLTPRPA